MDLNLVVTCPNKVYEFPCESAIETVRSDMVSGIIKDFVVNLTATDKELLPLFEERKNITKIEVKNELGVTIYENETFNSLESSNSSISRSKVVHYIRFCHVDE